MNCKMDDKGSNEANQVKTHNELACPCYWKLNVVKGDAN